MALSILPFLLAGYASARTGTAAPEPPGCEPASEVGMAARVVSRSESAEGVTVMIELVLDPHVTILDAAVEGVLLKSGRAVADPGLDERALTVLDGVRRKLLYRVDLARGEEHHIVFTLRGSPPDPGGPPPSAHLRVNLDDSREPEIHGDYLQYRTVPR